MIGNLRMILYPEPNQLINLWYMDPKKKKLTNDIGTIADPISQFVTNGSKIQSDYLYNPKPQGLKFGSHHQSHSNINSNN